MYLKRIETLGFKSFADKTIINFDQGVTGVVGPNGSGKSNVVDAVRWVLGEQSIKQLRGGTTMTDVIFSGSKSRKAHSYAYVTIVLDNSDKFIDVEYNEVEITRKVYRSGESDYLLNGVKCRLKDISDLVLDTGLGKESFNIISQDKVQSLLNSKAEDRRYIFEEAAGVLKYRKRKESANRKLATTDDNLSRVSDILSELENQVEPLRIQSEKAVKYLEAKESLESIEIALIAHEIHELSNEYKDLEKQSELINERIVSLTTDEYRSETKLDDTKNSIKQYDIVLEESNRELVRLTQLINDVKTEKKLFDERRKYNSVDSELIESKRKLQNLELELIDKVNNVKMQLSEIQSKKDKAIQIQSELNNTHSKLISKKQTLRDSYNSAEAKLLGVKSKITSFESNNNSSLYSGVAAVLNNPKLSGIIDIVSNVISVDEKFSVALDYSLGANSQFVICNSKNDASKAIEYLKQAKRGRATFMPLDNINVRKTEMDFSKYDGIYGFASDIVDTDDKYQDIVESIIGNIVIAENLEVANKFFSEVKKFRVITLTGEIINPRGSITGGNSNKAGGIFSARHEYETSKKMVVDFENNLNNILYEETTINKEIASLDSKLYTANVELLKLEENYNIKSETLNNYQNDLKDIKSELGNLASIEASDEDSEEKRIIDLIKKYQEDILDITTKIDTYKFKKAELLVDQEEYENAFKAVSVELKNDKKQLNTIDIQISRIDVKLENHLLRLSEEYSLTYEKAFEDYHLTIELEEAKAKVRTLKSKINSLGFVNVNAIEEYEVVKERYDFLTEQRSDILSAKEELLHTIEELDKTMKYQFSKTFDEVSEQYSIMFKQLFGGGNATLTLTDPSDLLNTGIEINAQPPGKKLQHLTLLSGGEKALSTLVLLFAILKVRPVPFSILDEVEAALDEANLARFAHFLEGFSSNIQFIIITHRKVTMENADVLYGVTMQESGVSKLVSVKLKEAAEMIGGDS